MHYVNKFFKKISKDSVVVTDQLIVKSRSGVLMHKHEELEPHSGR